MRLKSARAIGNPQGRENDLRAIGQSLAKLRNQAP